MRLLIVSSGNSGEISPIVRSQCESLENSGVNISYFLISGKGLLGYIKNIPKLWCHLKKNRYDLIHAHYSLSAIVASLVKKGKLVVSLMGSDVKNAGVLKCIVKALVRFSWDATIVKSNDMRSVLGLVNVHVIPNGVDISKYKPLNHIECKFELFWGDDKIHLLFAAHKDRPEKNYSLFEKSVNLIRARYPQLEEHFLNDIPFDRMPLYYNAADVVCLSSWWEGSPNVIKEAMACNRPIVSTNVGDIAWLFGDTPGHYLTGFSSEEMSSKIVDAIEFSKKVGQTDGRRKIINLGLDSKTIAKDLIALYNEVLVKNQNLVN